MGGRSRFRLWLSRSFLALAISFGASAAQATTVINLGDTALGILDLEIEGFELPFNVEFIFDDALSVYGILPGFDFTTEADAQAAVDAVNAALDEEGGINFVSPASARFFLVGFQTFEVLGFEAVAGFREDFGDQGGWVRELSSQENLLTTSFAFARFTEIPEPGTALLLGLGLAGLHSLGRSWRQRHRGSA